MANFTKLNNGFFATENMAPAEVSGATLQEVLESEVTEKYQADIMYIIGTMETEGKTNEYLVERAIEILEYRQMSRNRYTGWRGIFRAIATIAKICRRH